RSATRCRRTTSSTSSPRTIPRSCAPRCAAGAPPSSAARLDTCSSCRRGISMPTRGENKRMVAGAVLLAPLLTGGPDMYLDRREPVSFAAGDSVATAQAVQVIDPWPPAAYDRNIAYNGSRVAGAVERYRTGRIIGPKGTQTSTTYSAAPQVGQGGGAPNSAGASS